MAYNYDRLYNAGALDAYIEFYKLPGTGRDLLAALRGGHLDLDTLGDFNWDEYLLEGKDD